MSSVLDNKHAGLGEDLEDLHLEFVWGPVVEMEVVKGFVEENNSRIKELVLQILEWNTEFEAVVCLCRRVRSSRADMVVVIGKFRCFTSILTSFTMCVKPLWK